MFAVESQKRAANAWSKGYFKNSVTPVKDINGLTIRDRDEHMRADTSMQSLASLHTALVRIDIKRRDPLTGTVASPLAQMLSGVIPGRRLAVAPDPVALDLPDIDPADVTGTDRTGRPSWPQHPQRRPKEPAPAAEDDGGDISDWI